MLARSAALLDGVPLVSIPATSFTESLLLSGLLSPPCLLLIHLVDLFLALTVHDGLLRSAAA